MRRISMALFATSLMMLCQLVGAAEGVEANPAFKLDVSHPTADKPQSKLWYFQSSWWACLPTLEGNQLWRRTATGWSPAGGEDSPLRGLFGRGDVYAEDDRIHVVLVSPQALTMVALRYDSPKSDYVLAAPPTKWSFPAEVSLETATITMDQAGCLWVAYSVHQSVWVRASKDWKTASWTEPILLARGTSDDDICSIVRMRGGVGVVWSNQNDDSISFRFHRNEFPHDSWLPKEIAAQGGKTADDHLNCAVGKDGTLYVATKTSIDTLHKPLLSLRVRLPDGQWRSVAYSTLTSKGEPSRPIVMLSPSTKRLVLLHSLYGRQNPGFHSIIGLIRRYPDLDLTPEGVEMIPPIAGLNNVTGSKSFLPANVPAVVLASDGNGNVFEASFDLADSEETTRQKGGRRAGNAH